jgi:hypothetical protein
MNLSKIALLLLALLALTVLLTASVSADAGNEDPEDATDVYDGNSESHTVAAAGGGNPEDDDWFRVYLTEGQFLKLGTVFDPSSGWIGIRVYGPDGWTKLVAQDTRTDVNAQEIDMFVFHNGSYYIRVWIIDGDTAQYTMDVRVVTPPILASGNSGGNGGGLPLRGRIDSTMYYRIWLEGGNSSVELADAEMTWTGDTNTHLTVFDRRDDYSLGVLNYSWSRNMDHSESCRFAASYTGWYYIQAFTTTLYSDPIYGVFFTIKVTILPSTFRADGNVQRSDAEMIDIRQEVHGKINQAYDTHEWYKFYLNKDEQFSAKATVTDIHLTTYFDYYNLTLYTHNGTILAGAYNQGSTGAPISSCSIFQGRAPYTGLYYLRFSAQYSQSGSGPTDYTNGRLVNSCKYVIDILIPNRRVWIVDPPGEIRMDEDGQYTLDLTTIFWDPEADELSFGTQGGKDNFTLPLSQSTGILTIRPDTNWYGTDEITVWAHDGRPDQKNTTKITITVRSVADPPKIIDGAPIIVRIKEDEVNTSALDLYSIFMDVDIEDKFLIFSSDKNEKVNIDIHQTSGAVTLWGIENYNGEQRITFSATDSYNYRVSHALTIIVSPANDAPEAISKIPRLQMDEGTNSHIDVGPFFFDIDGDELYYYVSWEPSEAIAFDNADSNPLNSWYDIYPDDPNFNGYVQVTFKAYDRDILDPDMSPEEATQTAILEVANVNDPPLVDIWLPDDDQPTIDETESQIFEVPQRLIYDVDSNSFRWRWFVDDVEQVEVTGETFEFPKEPGYDDAGVYVIRCEVKDNVGEPANRAPEWILSIRNRNRDPSVYLISKDETVEEGAKIRLRADGNDPDDDSLTFEWFQLDDDGREQPVGLGRDYTMDKPLLPGSYRFKCYVSDGDSLKSSEQVQIDVKAHEFPPTIPGFGVFAMFGAMIGALALAVTMRRRT